MIHIAFNIDHHYVRHCAVTMVSVLENNKPGDVSFHILARGLEADDAQLLTRLCAEYGTECHFYTPTEKMLEGYRITKFKNRISIATYFRCLLSDLLPKEVERVIYLDCDIVVLHDLTELWATDLTGAGAAVVEDIGSDELARYEVLCYPAEKSYFNAGMMVVNLDYWRTHNVAKLCMDYYRQYPERILFNDQDLLNSVLQDDKRMVHLRWNVQDGFYRNRREMTAEWKDKYAEALKAPYILHYTNRKPWNYDSQHPLRRLYFDYLDKTPFKEERPWNSPTNVVKRFFRLLPFTLGLRRPKYLKLTDL